MSDSDQVNGNKFVRIDQDSDTELQALFDSVLKPNGRKPLSVPYSMRKLPKSFFNPPSTGSKSPSVSSISHSRENSGDSAFGNCITMTSGLHINHSRAHSSPASLQQTYSQQPTHQHQHLKQRSYDITTVDEHDLGPLPPGWEQAKTEEGQIYFLNHNEKTTTWDDPRKVNQQQCRNSITAAISSTSPVNDLHSLAQQIAGGVNSGGALLSSSTASSGTGSSGTLSPVGSELAVGPLPEGWEQANSKDGELYYINHLTRTTSWFDPRIPTQLQRAPPSGISPQTLNSWIQHQQPVSLSPAQVSRMESLKAERERLKMRQREIQQHDIMSRTRSADPFLSAAGVLATAPVEHTTHTRQESADSGLGMGNNYSLPHTPEDFLNSIDDNMDGVNEDTSAEISILDPQEISSLADHIDSTEDLGPPLRLEEYEILNDVINNANNRSNGLAWL